jgi:hypothetical protein
MSFSNELTRRSGLPAYWGLIWHSFAGRLEIEAHNSRTAALVIERRSQFAQIAVDMGFTIIHVTVRGEKFKAFNPGLTIKMQRL